MSDLRCPTCQSAVLPRAQNKAFPFCSPRCRAVDMGKWLGEEFKVVDTSAELEEDGAAPARVQDDEDLH